MSANLRFVIRDGIESDIEACLALDHTYSTDHVWQVSVERDEPHFYRTTFKTERLPRTLDAAHPGDERRIRLSLPDDQAFVVAAAEENSSILAYLTMRQEAAHRLAVVQDIVVDRLYRRSGIGARLLHIARRWARERDLARLMLEIHTRNFPAISFSQAFGLAFCGYNERYFGQQDIAVFFGQSLR